MTDKKQRSDYDEETTSLCERVLVTLLGDIGLWGERLFLVGGLAPRYLVGQLPEGVSPHVGTTDVDVVIAIALGDETPETYRTLCDDLRRAGFEQQEPSFQWGRRVEGVPVALEFLCETDKVESGRIFRAKDDPTESKGTSTGSGFNAFNVRGASLVRDDYIECEIEQERLDGGGTSKVSVRVANFLPFTVLKILAFQDRHAGKDAYDLVFTLLNSPNGPYECGLAATSSPVTTRPLVAEALRLLGDRFRDIRQDGPISYATFLAAPDNDEEHAQLCQRAVATVGEFLRGFGLLEDSS